MFFRLIAPAEIAWRIRSYFPEKSSDHRDFCPRAIGQQRGYFFQSNMPAANNEYIKIFQFNKYEV
jgi:hypothetical protein